jgi:RNAse (barnase) inhibitor barstar
MQPSVVMDGQNWITSDDFYDAFFQAVGAPSWHGRNFNALRDSIVVGRINKLDVPYLIRLKNYSLIGPGARGIAAEFIELIKELRESGCAVDISVEN